MNELTTILLTFISNINFGYITLAVFTTLAAYLVLYGTVEVLLLLVRWCLKAEHENAKKCGIGEVLSNPLKAIKFHKGVCSHEKEGYWTVAMTNEIKGGRRIKYTSKEAASEAFRKYKWFDWLDVLGLLLITLALDLVLKLFLIEPFITGIFLIVLSVGCSVRYISGKVWDNTGNIYNHEERITKLESNNDK